MASLIKANPRLTAGGVQLTTYTLTAQSDNSLAISAEFICLSQFDAPLASSFRIGAPLPQALADESGFVALLNSLRVSTTPTVSGVEISRNYGLTTFSLSLGVEMDVSVTEKTASGDVPAAPIFSETTTSTDLRSLSGSLVFSAGTEQEISRSFSFDYYATSVTVENAEARPVAPSEPFNVRSPIRPREYIQTQDVFSIRTFRNSVGQMKTTNTVTRIYVQNKFTG